MREGPAGWIAAALVVASAATGALAGDAADRAWCQDAANASRTSAVDVEPIRNDPVEAWTKRLDEGAIAAPVCWGGTVFVLSKDAQKRQVLSALDARTGDVLARTVRFSHTGPVAELVVWEGTVAVVERTSIEGFAFKGAAFKQTWRRDGREFAFPCVYEGQLFVADLAKPEPADVRQRGIERVFGIVDGKERASHSQPLGGAVCIARTLRSDADAQIVGLGVQTRLRYVGMWLCAQAAGLHSERSGQPLDFFGLAPDLAADGALAVLRQAGDLVPWYGVVRMLPNGRGRGAWLFLSGVDLMTQSGTPCQMFVQPDVGEGGLLPTTIRPAVRNGIAYTFDTKGNLLAIGTDGRFEFVLEGGKLPPGAAAGVPSIARNVICFGNWAADLDSRRVLWVRPSSSAVLSPAIPAADGLLVGRTAAAEIRCLRDPKAAAQPAAPAEAKAAPAAPLALPKAMDGVLLRDGRQFGGSVLAGADGSVLVTPEGGAARSFDGADVVVAEENGVVVAHAPESEVHRVWRDAVRAAHVRRLEELFGAAMELEIPAKASEILDRARAWGMPEPRAAELARRITGKRDAVNVDLKLRGFAKREGPVLDATCADVLEGAKWCGARGFPTAGATLLALALELDPGRADAVEAALPLVPREFPVRTNAARAWLAWAPYMLAADAHFLGELDPAWRRTSTAPWNKDTIGLRTPNVLLFSRASDAAVVGPCLARGEQAVRAVRTLLGVAEDAAAVADEERLEVRLHRDRNEYVAEAKDAFIQMTLGYFSPRENVSRFYVPAQDDSPLPLGRGLFKTMAHELTHHYVEARWAPRNGGAAVRTGSVPGFWIVEGLARFVEDQVVDSDTRGLTFGDATVPSVDAACRLAETNQLLPTDWICDADQRGFRALATEPLIDVRLARSLLAFRLSQANVFYEQAGALVFWLWNRGPEGRTALVDYLRLHYSGTLSPLSWRRLGFETSAGLDRAFREWLSKLGR